MTLQQPTARLRPFRPIQFGRYTLLAQIGAGGMGEVYLARMEGAQGFEKFLVIKKILSQLSAEPDFVNRFVSEARVLARLTHGSIAQVLDVGLHEGDTYIALEHVDGKDLRKVAARMRERHLPPPLTFVLFVMGRVLDALAYAHRKRDDEDQELHLVHRDISPQNILVSYEGEVKIIDFGLAKSTLSVSKTNPSIVLGKFLYMSPEQARHQQVDRRSDLYSVGLCMYELIAGKNPFDDSPPGELMAQVGDPKIPPLQEVDPLCPGPVSAMVMKAISVDPAERFQTAEEFRARVLAALHEIDFNAGPETVSKFMRETFAGEYQAERRLLASVKEMRAQQPAASPSTATVPPPSANLSETGTFPLPREFGTDPKLRRGSAASRQQFARVREGDAETEASVPITLPPQEPQVPARASGPGLSGPGVVLGPEPTSAGGLRPALAPQGQPPPSVSAPRSMPMPQGPSPSASAPRSMAEGPVVSGPRSMLAPQPPPPSQSGPRLVPAGNVSSDGYADTNPRVLLGKLLEDGRLASAEVVDAELIAEETPAAGQELLEPEPMPPPPPAALEGQETEVGTPVVEAPEEAEAFEEPPRKSSRKGVLAALAVLLLVGGGAAAYFLMPGSPTAPTPGPSPVTPEAAPADTQAKGPAAAPKDGTAPPADAKGTPPGAPEAKAEAKPNEAKAPADAAGTEGAEKAPAHEVFGPPEPPKSTAEAAKAPAEDGTSPTAKVGEAQAKAPAESTPGREGAELAPLGAGEESAEPAPLAPQPTAKKASKKKKSVALTREWSKLKGQYDAALPRCGQRGMVQLCDRYKLLKAEYTKFEGDAGKQQELVTRIRELESDFESKRK